MKITVFLTLLLLAVGVQAADWRDGGYPDTIVISSLPYTVSNSNTTYRLSGNLSSNDGGIAIQGPHDVEIIGAGDTITFDVDGSGGVSGLSIGNNSHHVIVRDLTITQAVNQGSYGSPGGDNATGIQIYQCEYVYVYNCNAHVGGHSSMCVDGGDGYKQAIEFDGGNYTSFVRSFDSRYQADATAFKLSEPRPNPDTTFHFYVHNIRIDSTCHAGLLVGGIAWVDSNYVKIDTYNQKPNTSWANAHAIADAGRALAGSHFNYNTIRSGTNHYGGRGMYFNFSSGTAEAPVEMAYNDIRVTQGYTTEADDARGLRVRWGCFYLRVHSNYIEVSCDDDPNTQYIGSQAHGIWFGAIGEEGSQLGAHNWFYNNEIHANYYGDPSNAPGVATCFIADQIRDPNQILGNDNRTFNNHFYSNLRCLQIGEDGHDGNEWVSVGDTLEWLDPQYTGTWGFHGAVGVGAGGMLALNNHLIDPVFINCSSADVTNRSGGGSKSIYVDRTVRVTVTGSQNSEPIPGATVRIFNRFGNPANNASAVATIQTNSRGVALDTLPYAWHKWDGYNETGDSTYNDYTVKVEAFGKASQATVSLTDVAPGRVGAEVVDLALDTLGQTVTNVAPTAPTLASPANGSVAASLQPTLVVNNGSDADGDNLTYDFELYDASGTNLIMSQSGIPQSVSVTSWGVSSTLVSGTQYRWRARCSDGMDYSPWMNMATFTTPASQQDNTPPDAPAMHSPTQGAITNQSTPTLSVLNATDDDGDNLTYSFEVYNAAGATLVASASAVAEGSSYTTWTVSPALDDNTTYSWRARCYDGVDYSSWTSPWQFTVNQSNPLDLPSHASPLAGETWIGEPIVLTVNNSGHEIGADVTYDFYVYGDGGLTQQVDQMLDVPEGASQTSATCSFSPVQSHTYWWQVQASDGSYQTPLTTATSFTFYSSGTSVTTIAGTSYPPSGGTVSARRPQLTALNIEEPGTHDYYFEVATDPAFSNLVDVSGAVPQGISDETTWQVNEELNSGDTYYWHVRADNYAFSPTASFAVVPDIFAYPNPVRFSQDGYVTFQLPDEATDLMIQTVSGETVLVKKNVSGDWQWDGRNSAGNPISVGTYLWYVSINGQHGKLVVKP